MIKKHTEKKEIEQNVIDDIVCNQCGISLEDEDTGDMNGLVEAEVIGGEFSSDFADGELYQFSLCEPCLVKLFASFKHDPYQGDICPECGELGCVDFDVETEADATNKAALN